MARKKVTPEKRLAEAVKELGLGKAQDFLDFLRLYDGNEKSLGTDPSPKARRRQMNPKTVSPPSDDSQ